MKPKEIIPKFLLYRYMNISKCMSVRAREREREEERERESMCDYENICYMLSKHNKFISISHVRFDLE